MKFNKITAFLCSALLMVGASACGEFEPELMDGEKDVPSLPTVENLIWQVEGRNFEMTWTLPTNTEETITDVIVIPNGNFDAAVSLGPDATSYQLRKQTLTDAFFTVKVKYGEYVSKGVSTSLVSTQKVILKRAFLLLDNSVADIADDDERAAAEWFAQQANTEFIHISDLATISSDVYGMIWIMIDRIGLDNAWTGLPAELISQSTINALKAYSADGGALYLSNMATKLTVPLGIVPDTMEPLVFGSGLGGEHGDHWVINPNLGWDFKDNPNADQGFYDRTSHAIFQGLTLEDPNNYGYPTLPLLGPGSQEDHNCLWDCNIYGRGSYADVIKNFESITGSLVLATWGHVRDHCVAGLVDFYGNTTHGACVANGLGAYEWNQNRPNDGTVNIYQKNIEGLTLNILNYLCPAE